MTADETVTRAAEVIERHLPAMHDQQSARLSVDMARALDTAGLLAGPEHDAAVAARALREAAPDLNCHDDYALLRDRADLIEREGGA